ITGGQAQKLRLKGMAVPGPKRAGNRQLLLLWRIRMGQCLCECGTGLCKLRRRLLSMQNLRHLMSRLAPSAGQRYGQGSRNAKRRKNQVAILATDFLVQL